ncbi:MAG: hypothetical protein M3Y84_13535, partial [Acidobacteriota bacterium]|nr:hypothetical protein [Acidobacteriota bacterium]
VCTFAGIGCGVASAFLAQAPFAPCFVAGCAAGIAYGASGHLRIVLDIRQRQGKDDYVQTNNGGSSAGYDNGSVSLATGEPTSQNDHWS